MGKLTDLLLLVASSAALVSVVALAPSLLAVRSLFGLTFVLFFPGYALVAALFPRGGEPHLFERAALSFGLSLAIVSLIGLALNYSPWGIRLWPLIASLGVFAGLCASVAAFRRLRLPAGESLRIALPTSPVGRLTISSAVP